MPVQILAMVIIGVREIEEILAKARSAAASAVSAAIQPQGCSRQTSQARTEEATDQVRPQAADNSVRAVDQ